MHAEQLKVNATVALGALDGASNYSNYSTVHS